MWKDLFFAPTPAQGKTKAVFVHLDCKLFLKCEDRSYDCPLVPGCSKEIIFRQKKKTLTRYNSFIQVKMEWNIGSEGVQWLFIVSINLSDCDQTAACGAGQTQLAGLKKNKSVCGWVLFPVISFTFGCKWRALIVKIVLASQFMLTSTYIRAHFHVSCSRTHTWTLATAASTPCRSWFYLPITLYLHIHQRAKTHLNAIFAIFFFFFKKKQNKKQTFSKLFCLITEIYQEVDEVDFHNRIKAVSSSITAHQFWSLSSRAGIFS